MKANKKKKETKRQVVMRATPGKEQQVSAVMATIVQHLNMHERLRGSKLERFPSLWTKTPF